MWTARSYHWLTWMDSAHWRKGKWTENAQPHSTQCCAVQGKISSGGQSRRACLPFLTSQWRIQILSEHSIEGGKRTTVFRDHQYKTVLHHWSLGLQEKYFLAALIGTKDVFEWSNFAFETWRGKSFGSFQGTHNVGLHSLSCCMICVSPEIN